MLLKKHQALGISMTMSAELKVTRERLIRVYLVYPVWPSTMNVRDLGVYTPCSHNVQT